MINSDVRNLRTDLSTEVAGPPQTCGKDVECPLHYYRFVEGSKSYELGTSGFGGNLFSQALATPWSLDPKKLPGHGYEASARFDRQIALPGLCYADQGMMKTVLP